MDLELYGVDSKFRVDAKRIEHLDFFLFEIVGVKSCMDCKHPALNLSLRFMGRDSVYFPGEPIVRHYQLVGEEYNATFLREMNTSSLENLVGMSVKVLDVVDYPYAKGSIRGILPVNNYNLNGS